MIKRITAVALLAAFICVDASAQSRVHRRRGALLGGLAGAAIGVAIGDKGDNETAGALIGGAVGAIAGGTIGDQKDKRIDHYRRYHSGQSYRSYPQHYVPPHSTHTSRQYYQPKYFPEPAPAVAPPVDPIAQTTQPLSSREVVIMVQKGLSEPLIIKQIKLNGVQQQLSVSDVIELHQQGVSEAVIVAMQDAAPLPGGSVIVEPTQSYNVPIAPSEGFGTSIMAPSN